MLRVLVVCFALSLAGCSADSTPPAKASPAPTPAAGKADKKALTME